MKILLMPAPLSPGAGAIADAAIPAPAAGDVPPGSRIVTGNGMNPSPAPRVARHTRCAVAKAHATAAPPG